MAEKFCLKWNDFSSNVSKSFGLFKTADYLHDVTLVSDDHKQFSAHKLVLSACSEYFRTIFKNNANKNVHPLLCLDGISSADLDNIVEYIYNGEIQIYQDNLDRFLTIAQRFRLEGLLSNEDEGDAPAEDFAQDSKDIFTPIQDSGNIEEKLSPPESNSKTRKEHHSVHSSKEIESMEKIIVSVSAEQINDIENKASQHVERCEDGRFRCTLCGTPKAQLEITRDKSIIILRLPTLKEFQFLANSVERHSGQETHLEPTNLCFINNVSLCRSRNAFNLHKSRHHRC